MRYSVVADSVGSVGASGPVVFTAPHREGNPSAAVVTLSLSVPMSVEDLTAVVWVIVRDDRCEDAVTELEADPAYTHRIILEFMMGSGAIALEDARCALATVPQDDSPMVELVARMRALVTRLYGTPNVPQPRGLVWAVAR